MSNTIPRFPGRIFDADGKALDGSRPDLTQAEIDTWPLRAAVQTGTYDLSPVCRIWLLDPDARFRSIPPDILGATVSMALADQSILLLSRHPESHSEIVNALLDALELARTPSDAAGHA